MAESAYGMNLEGAAELLKRRNEEFAKSNENNQYGAGADAGAMIGGWLARKMGRDKEYTNAKSLDEALTSVEETWEDDRSALPSENEANKLEAIRKATYKFLTPEQRLQLSAQHAAARTDAWNQRRLVASDSAEATAADDKHKDALLDYQIDERKLKHDRLVQKHGSGAELGVFKMGDGSSRQVGMDGREWFQLMKLANDPKSGVRFLGMYDDLERRNLELLKSAAKGRKTIKLTDAKGKQFQALAQMGQIFGDLSSAEGQAGLDRFGSFGALLDEAKEKIAGFGPMGWVMDQKSKSSLAAVAVSQLSVAQQALIQGVPSNYDQYLIELTKPNRRWTNPAIARQRIDFLKRDVTQRIRAAYADFRDNAPEDQPVPADLVNAMRHLGVLPSSVLTQEEELAELEALGEEVRASFDEDTRKAAEARMSADARSALGVGGSAAGQVKRVPAAPAAEDEEIVDFNAP